MKLETKEIITKIYVIELSYQELKELRDTVGRSSGSYALFEKIRDAVNEE